MKVIINAINLSSAGGLTVAKNFFNQLPKYVTHQFILIVPKNCGYEDYSNEMNVQVIAFDSKWTGYLGRIIFDYFLIKLQIRKHVPDVIFTMGNFAVPIKKYKQLLFFAWPYGVYPESIKELNFGFYQRIIQYLRLFSFKSRLRYASEVAAQTEVDKQLLEKMYPFVPSVKVVPNAYSAISINNNEHTTYNFLHTDDKKNLLCLARYYLHKNLEILLEVASIFKQKVMPYRIILTIDSNDHPNASKIINEIDNRQLGGYITNIGRQPLEQINELYLACNGLVLPSLLEAYSTTYADSLFLCKPIFTSNRKFAYGVCEDAGFYFDPHSPQSIVDVIDEAFKNKGLLTKKVSQGKSMSENFPSWEEVAIMYINLLEGLNETNNTVL